MRILVSSSDIESCKQFKKYLIKYVDKDLEVEILKNFYSKKIKNPNKLNLYYLNIYFMYSILCSRNFNSFIQATRDRTHRLNIIKYLYITFLRYFLKFQPNIYFFIYKQLWKSVILKHVFLEQFKYIFIKKKNNSCFHFHLGTLGTDIEIDTCIKSKLRNNKIIYLPSNWDNINSKSFIPINFYEHVMSWDPIVTRNYPTEILGETSLSFTSSFKLNYLLNIDLKIKKDIVVCYGTQKDIPFELNKVLEIKRIFDKYYPNFKFIYRPHPYALDLIFNLISKKEFLSKESPLIINLEPKFEKIYKKEKQLEFDFTPLEKLLNVSKVSISQGSTTSMEASLNGNVSILLNANPIQVTLRSMHYQDHYLTLLTLPGTYICSSILILKLKLDELLIKNNIDHYHIRESALRLFKPSIFNKCLKDIIF